MLLISTFWVTVRRAPVIRDRSVEGRKIKREGKVIDSVEINKKDDGMIGKRRLGSEAFDRMRLG